MKEYLLCLPLLLLVTSCWVTKDSDCNPSEVVTLVDASGLDGCTWLMERNNGSRIHPVNLVEHISDPVDGHIYKVDYTLAEDLASICMAGDLVRLDCAVKD